MAYGAQAVDNPDVFKGVAVQRVDPFPVITGSAYSSHAPASAWFHPVTLGEPLALSNIYVVKSMNAVVPTATGQASTGTEAYSYGHYVSIFRRQDYAANSSNLVFVASASGGLTANLSYQASVGGSSQTFAMSWLTDTTGGVGSFSTTSNAGNWSSYATGAKLFPIPFRTVLSQGEYFVGHQHSSTTGTTNSNVTLLSMSNLHLAPQVLTYGSLGTTQASLAGIHLGLGVASAVTTNATMASSVISAGTANQWVQYYSNA